MQWIPPHTAPDDKPDKEEALRQMGQAMDVFVETLQKFMGKRCLVSFAVMDEANRRVALGTHLSKGSSGHDLMQMSFELNRAYTSMLKQNGPNPN